MPIAGLSQAVRVIVQGLRGFGEYVPTTLGGTSNAYNLLALNASGIIDPSVLPPGIMADVANITASTALTAGQLVNVYNSGSQGSPIFSVQPADATSGLAAHGYVVAAVTSGGTASVYFTGLNTAVSGLAPGYVYLGSNGSTASAGATTVGSIYQIVGEATSSGVLQFNPLTPTTRA